MKAVVGIILFGTSLTAAAPLVGVGTSSNKTTLKDDGDGDRYQCDLYGNSELFGAKMDMCTMEITKSFEVETERIKKSFEVETEKLKTKTNEDHYKYMNDLSAMFREFEKKFEIKFENMIEKKNR